MISYYLNNTDGDRNLTIPAAYSINILDIQSCGRDRHATEIDIFRHLVFHRARIFRIVLFFYGEFGKKLLKSNPQ